MVRTSKSIMPNFSWQHKVSNDIPVNINIIKDITSCRTQGVKSVYIYIYIYHILMLCLTYFFNIHINGLKKPEKYESAWKMGINRRNPKTNKNFTPCLRPITARSHEQHWIKT